MPKDLKFTSLARSRLAAALVLLVTALVQYVQWGFAFATETAKANWLVLGGPTLFLPTAFFPTLFAVGLLIYVVASFKRVSLERRDDAFTITERRLSRELTTEVPRDEVHYIGLSNSHAGARLLWVLPFGIHAWWLGVDAFSFLCNPFAFGRGYVTGFFYLLQVAADGVALYLLLFRHQLSIEIHTRDSRYELQLATDPRDAIPKLARLFGVPRTAAQVPVRELGPEPLDGPVTGHSWTSRFLRYRRVAGGVAFVLVAVFSRAYNVYAGDPLKLVLFLGGLVWITRGVKVDVAGVEFLETRGALTGTHDLVVERRSGRFLSTQYFPGLGPDQATKQWGLPRFDAWDAAIVGSVAAVCSLQVGLVALLVPDTNPLFGSLLGVQILGAAGLLSACWFVYYLPERFLVVSRDPNRYDFPIGKLGPYRALDGARKRSLHLRLAFVALASLLGATVAVVTFLVA
ncbi:MAG: hypothetical protein ACTSU5_04285 [Promethearchaeota archaeon]